jgi:Cd2+/Zn2+-exporting ATPase
MSAECCEKNSSEETEEGEKKSIVVLLIRLSLSAILSVLGYFVFSEEKGYPLYLNALLFGSAWLLSAYDLVYKAFRGLFKGKNPFDENMLMVIASLGAFSLRFFGHNEFIEAVMVVFLYQIGELLEDFATDKSHKAISEAVGLRAKFANKLTSEGWEQVPPESLQIGDEILIKVGEIVPADGSILEGEGSLDMSSLTGEFVPVYKKKGEAIPSGVILKEGSLKLKVEKAYADSTVAKIIHLVDDSSKSKCRADKFITRFSRIYTPIVVSLALLVALVPPLFLGIGDSEVWFKWLYTAICLLVISCPCAIVISVPLAYFSGIGLASKHGIVIKGASYFDKLNDLDVLVSDKTGTLTYGDFRLSEIDPEPGHEKEFLSYLQASESESNHPIAKAILPSKDGASFAEKITHYEELAGKGIKAVYEGHTLLSGTRKFLLEEGVAVADFVSSGTVVCLAVDGLYWGHVVLNDVIRKESESMVEGLKKLGVQTVMLTGDKEKSAHAVCETLGIEECHSELLPEEKKALLQEKITSDPKAVAYIGDGINDAPSIILADVGVAMGGVGSDMAIDCADVVIMNDDPSKVVTALKIARLTRRRAIEDIIIALSVKLAIMLCALFVPGFPLLVAVLADTGLTVLLVLFSVLLLKKKI